MTSIRRVALLLLMVWPSLAQEPDLVVAARKTLDFWTTKFLHCPSASVPGGAWYSVWTKGPQSGLIQETTDVAVQFSTSPIGSVARMNGVEFSATSQLSGSLSRFWTSQKGWSEWGQENEVAPSFVLTKKRGQWATQLAPGRVFDGVAPKSCSEIPGENTATSPH